MQVRYEDPFGLTRQWAPLYKSAMATTDPIKAINIEKFVKSDLEEVHCLIHDTINNCYINDYPDRAVQYFRDLYTKEKIIEKNAEGVTLIARCAGKIIGTGTAIENEISGVFVDLRCQRLGVGQRIMKMLENHLAEAGVPSATLAVSLPSIKFYKSLGYAGFDEKSIDVGEDQHLKYWVAVKTLA